MTTAFPADPQATDTTVSGVEDPAGTGTVGFSPSLTHTTIGDEWATWSNGYSGDVYINEGGQDVTLTLPSGTRAFYFYAEPDEFSSFDFTATSSDGTTSGAVSASGYGGATYFGFYATGTATLTSISVSETDPDGFAIGEFGISTGTEQVVVNAEAWIPQTQVADPYLPVSQPYTTAALQTQDPNCYTPSAGQQYSTYVTSTYVGDGSAAFGAGTYRLRTEVSFDFDPTTDQISNFAQDAVPAYDAGYFHKVYTNASGTVLDTCNVTLKTAYSQTARQTSSTGFTLGYVQTNPLGDSALAPLSASINASVTADGGVSFRYATSEFPSQGIQVTFGGNVVGTDIVNDVSCLSPSAVLGFSGRTLMENALSQTERGSATIEPYANSTVATPSPICSAPPIP